MIRRITQMKLNKSNLVASLQYELFFAIALFLLPIYETLFLEKNYGKAINLISILVILVIMFIQMQVFKGKK